MAAQDPESAGPESAARIHPHDAAKLTRAIEVCLAAKKAHVRAAGARPAGRFRLLRIGLNPPRKALYERLNRRAAAMFAAGLVEETRTLFANFGTVKAWTRWLSAGARGCRGDFD